MMGKSYVITEDDVKAIRQAMDKKENARCYKRLLAVALRGEGKKNDEIGLILQCNPQMVSQWVSRYVREGIESLAKDGRKGGNNRNMGAAEAEEFLEQFREQAERGQIITVEEIAAAYDQKTGKNRESLSTVYKFLHMQGWRLIRPKKQHPGKASAEVIDTSKKLTLDLRK